MSPIHLMLPATALVLALGQPLQGDEASSEAMLDRHQRAVENFNAHDLDAALDGFYAEDATLHDPQIPGAIVGRDSIREVYEAFLASFPDGQVEILNRDASDDILWYELRLTGTNDGPLVTPEGELAATGRSIDIPAAVVAEVGEDGHFHDVRRYYDVAEMARQLGLDE